MKRWQIITTSLIGIGILLGAGLLGWYHYNLRPVAAGAALQFTRVETGASVAEIAAQLQEERLIRNQHAFRAYLYQRGIASKIQAGVYQISAGQSSQQIGEVLTSGETVTKVITVIGGMRLEQIVEELRKHDYNETAIKEALGASYNYPILADKPDAASLEGYLYPDTYHVDPDSHPQVLVDFMLKNMDQKVTPDLRRAWARQGLNLHEAITLASIVQKEVPTPAEQQRVAQVFLQRLKHGMKLETDPTFQYAARLLKVPPSPAINSPYNTYMHKGLPPGPIGTVEQSSLEAVANPESGDYLYFVTGKDGVTRFSRSREQHEALIKKHGVSQNN